ncbi:MAG: ATP-dependent Clp protease proteolytic subunit [Prevotella sp.]|nr:ATP-dependent Clp protease proteolytic subunit [Prevotella sp.]
MPTWDEILKEVGASSSIFDVTRRKYIHKLSEYTGRNTIVYYSGFLQKSQLSRQGVDFSINDNDKNGFMTVVNKLDRKKGLDLILHTPGGDVASTESIVNYIKSIFGNDIRAIVPQIAMSAGTMIACSCKSIVMGKQSNLGPIDPQLGIYPAHGIIEEFKRIQNEIQKDPRSIVLWREVLAKYHPTLIGECEKAIEWADTMVKEWLEQNMFLKEPSPSHCAKKVVEFLGSHSATLSHSRHLHVDNLKGIGLKIEEMEKDQDLQDLILSVHHSMVISITQTNVIKIIENNQGKAFIQQV